MNGGATPDRSLPIAVFDSGVGGLTVLHEFLVSLPAEDFVYLGDTAYFPYGIKPADELRARVDAISRLLLERGTKLLVIACNAATSVARDIAATVGANSGTSSRRFTRSRSSSTPFTAALAAAAASAARS